ncbi:MAG TPA: hypothetical protein VMR41_00865 [Patescibacteria group bacterium]|nr:hypothetical protein [Patescibacteria group bacterium]
MALRRIEERVESTPQSLIHPLSASDTKPQEVTDWQIIRFNSYGIGRSIQAPDTELPQREIANPKSPHRFYSKMLIVTDDGRQHLLTSEEQIPKKYKNDEGAFTVGEPIKKKGAKIVAMHVIYNPLALEDMDSSRYFHEEHVRNPNLPISNAYDDYYKNKKGLRKVVDNLIPFSKFVRFIKHS